MRWHVVLKTHVCSSKVKVVLNGKCHILEMVDFSRFAYSGLHMLPLGIKFLNSVKNSGMATRRKKTHYIPFLRKT